MTHLRFKCIACDVFAGPIYLSAAQSPHIVDVVLEELGLHISPKKLHDVLQAHIDGTKPGVYDAILLAYGLCGTASQGLCARHLPVVLPRAHDCITLFLGSRKRYEREFSACSGTYWYVQDFTDRIATEKTSRFIGANTSVDSEALYGDYVKKYGEDNAAYLMDVMSTWQKYYERAAYIDTGEGDGQATIRRAMEDAAQRGWRFEKLAGDLLLLRRLLNGDWDNDFLILQPGQQVEMVAGEAIIQARAG